MTDTHTCPEGARCPDCGSIPLDLLHTDDLREAMRRVAEDACGLTPSAEEMSDPLLKAIDRLTKPTAAVDWLLRAGKVVEKLNETSRRAGEPNKQPVNNHGD
jgi:hypothetical protein